MDSFSIAAAFVYSVVGKKEIRMEQNLVFDEPATAAAWANPPLLKGFAHLPADAYRARDQRKLLALRVETNACGEAAGNRCESRCPAGSPREAGLDFLKDVIRQAKELGARSVVVTGSEPALYSKFRGLIQYITSRDLTPVVFTNLSVIDRALADFLFRRHVSVLGKLDSLQPERLERLVGRPGASEEIRQGLQHLLDAGFGKTRNGRFLRLGLSFAVRGFNQDEIEAVWHFCRQQDIFPHIELGQALDGLEPEGLRLADVQEARLNLLRVDHDRYGYDWLPYTPLAGSHCLQQLCSLYITVDGDVRPCAGTPFEQLRALQTGGLYPHNLKHRSLREVYDSDLFSYVRNIDAFLEGKCRRCMFLDQCIGCRGRAFSAGISRGLDPFASLRQECGQCFKD
jgi:radical SAM protein with 4Fe4S-binding SPASM domain